MQLLKKRSVQVLIGVILLLVLLYSIKLVAGILAGIGALFFGESQKEQKLKEIDKASSKIKEDIEQVNLAHEAITDDLVQKKQSEIDQWLDS
jgi:cellobiose-specific phosphotransferase system component IIA